MNIKNIENLIRKDLNYLGMSDNKLNQILLDNDIDKLFKYCIEIDNIIDIKDKNNLEQFIKNNGSEI